MGKKKSGGVRGCSFSFSFPSSSSFFSTMMGGGCFSYVESDHWDEHAAWHCPVGDSYPTAGRSRHGPPPKQGGGRRYATEAQRKEMEDEEPDIFCADPAGDVFSTAGLLGDHQKFAERRKKRWEGMKSFFKSATFVGRV